MPDTELEQARALYAVDARFKARVDAAIDHQQDKIADLRRSKYPPEAKVDAVTTCTGLSDDEVYVRQYRAYVAYVAIGDRSDYDHAKELYKTDAHFRAQLDEAVSSGSPVEMPDFATIVDTVYKQYIAAGKVR